MIRFLFLVIVLLQSIFLYSQNWNLVYTKELEAEDFLYEKQYDKALKKYGEALKIAPSSANLKFKVGMCYLSTVHSKHLALDYLKEAADNTSVDFDSRAIKEIRSPIEAHYYLGIAYQINEQFQEAIASFNTFKSFLEPDDPRLKDVNNRIETCRIAPNLIVDRIGVSAENLGNIINNKDLNFNAVISGDGNTLAYTTQKGGRYDIYVSRKKEGEWQKPRRITDDIRGGYLKTVSLSFDGEWLYMVDDFSSRKQIYDTFYDRGWVKSKKLKKPITSKKYNETHAAVSPDGKTLYFASDRPEGSGGLDIYKATLDDKERWDNVVSLGPRVNTEFDEDTPFVTPDGRYLFFSSKGHSGIGGFDIFYIDLEGSGKPVNLGYPINNADDNLFYYPLSLTKGLMALSKPDALGPQDIYEMTIVPLVNISGNIAVVGEKPQDVTDVKISIFDAEAIEPVAEITKPVTEKTFSKKLLPGEYRVEAKATGFEDFATVLAVAKGEAYQNLDVNLIPILKEPEEKPALAQVEAEVIEAVPEEVKEELVEKPVVPKPEPKPEPVPVPEPEPLPEPRSELKPLVVDNAQPAEGLYTVQIMALLVPVPESYFKNIEGVTVTKGSDGYNRYSIGAVASRSEAVEIQQKLIALGYKDSFVKRFTSSASNRVVVDSPISNYMFGIQVLALRNPLLNNRFKGTEVTVVQGDDGFYRYFAGQYSTYQQACNDLNRVIKLGHKNAFIKRL